MSDEAWVALIGVLSVVAIAAVGSYAAMWVKLHLIAKDVTNYGRAASEKSIELDKDFELLCKKFDQHHREVRDDVQKIWGAVNEHGGSISTINILFQRVLDKMDLSPAATSTPSQK